MKNLFKLIIILCIGYGSYFGVVNDEGEKAIDMTNVEEEQQAEPQSQNNTIGNLVQEIQKENEQEQKNTADTENKTQIDKKSQKQENKIQTANEKNNSTSITTNNEVKKVEQSQTKETNISNANVNKVQNTETQKENNKEQTESKKETKYVRNDGMIQKIKVTIENNVTEDMKKYGYEIVIDSSIKELTNQFTFTETRVKKNIRYSFGTIRIYAEDYYSNGQLIMTECYIL
mgnify:FL=1